MSWPFSIEIIYLLIRVLKHELNAEKTLLPRIQDKSYDAAEYF